MTPSPYQDRHQSGPGSPGRGLEGGSGVQGEGEEKGGVVGASTATFRIEGMNPAPQGSKRHVGKGRMVESCADVKPWRLLVCQSAIAAQVPMIRGPVRLSLVFVFSRPAGHFRKDGSLKPSAPRYHCVKPDGSKLQRSTEDALTGVCIEDDARIVGTNWEKRYVVGDERPGALVTIIGLT